MALETARASAQTAITEKILESNAKTAGQSTTAMSAGAIGAAAILFAVWFANLIGLRFQDNLTTVIPSLLGSMLLVSLFVERAVEVFVSIFRNQQASIHEQNLSFWQTRNRRLTDDISALVAERSAPTTPDEVRKAAIDAQILETRDMIAEAINNADVEEKALLPYRSTTRRATAAVALVIGMLAASVGFRFFFQIVKFDSPHGPAADQIAWFGLVDVLLTGAVLSGGSQAIHQILSVYTQFMESTQKSVATRA